MERAIRYVRDSFWAGRLFTTLAECDRQALLWRHQIAHQRPCLGDDARTVAQIFAEERLRLLAHPLHPFSTDLDRSGPVGQDHLCPLRSQRLLHRGEVPGVIQSMAQGSREAVAQVLCGTHHLQARVLAPADELASLVNAEVKLRGVAGALFNDRRQMLGIGIRIQAPFLNAAEHVRSPNVQLEEGSLTEFFGGLIARQELIVAVGGVRVDDGEAKILIVGEMRHLEGYERHAFAHVAEPKNDEVGLARIVGPGDRLAVIHETVLEQDASAVFEDIEHGDLQADIPVGQHLLALEQGTQFEAFDMEMAIEAPGRRMLTLGEQGVGTNGNLDVGTVVAADKDEALGFMDAHPLQYAALSGFANHHHGAERVGGGDIGVGFVLLDHQHAAAGAEIFRQVQPLAPQAANHQVLAAVQPKKCPQAKGLDQHKEPQDGPEDDDQLANDRREAREFQITLGAPSHMRGQVLAVKGQKLEGPKKTIGRGGTLGCVGESNVSEAEY